MKENSYKNYKHGGSNRCHSHLETSSPNDLQLLKGVGVFLKSTERRHKMNNKGNIMINLLFFIIGLGVLIAFISPINEFIDEAQTSQNLNCKGFIYNGDNSSTLSFNATANAGASGSPIACLTLKLYLPYILLVFLIGGLAGVLGGKTEQFFGGQEQQPY